MAPPRYTDDDDASGGDQERYRDDEVSETSGNHLNFEDTALVAASEASDEEQFEADDAWTRNVIRRIPYPVRRVCKRIAVWVKGPQPPRIWKIRPLFPAVQEAPIRLLDRYLPKRRHRVLLLLAFYACWAVTFASVLYKSSFASDVPGYGAPRRIDCGDRFWRDGNGCGVNGDLCRPFDNSTFTFRCPANCKRVQVVNPYAVGDQEINYRPLVIGGTVGEGTEDERTLYRGDSYICGAAIHAGFVHNSDGGCGVMRKTGEGAKFPSYRSHGISSIGFDSYFPLAFEFVPGTSAQCRDLRWPLLAVSLVYTALLSLFTTHVAVFFWTLFTGVFFHVGLASDPPALANYYQLVSIALGRFLPACFCGFAVYRFCTLPQQRGLTAQVEKTVLWVGGLWVGALNNYTFDKIPIQRLTPHDIRQQPGAIPALIGVVVGLFVIALGQAWCLRVEGKLPRYLGVYGTFVGSLLVLVAVPRMNVRIHHYILGLLLVPGTAMQTRPSLLFQGVLVGLFVNGIARWGFDSVLQTPAELRGDARLGTPLPQFPAPPEIHNNFGLAGAAPNITFRWARPLPRRYDGVSVIVNDVERFRAYEDAGDVSFSWERAHRDAGDEDPAGREWLPEYFRFAYLRGAWTADYTKAGRWGADGRWTEMAPGPGL